MGKCDWTMAEARAWVDAHKEGKDIIIVVEDIDEFREVEISLMAQIMDKLDAWKPTARESEIVIEPPKQIEVESDKSIEIVLDAKQEPKPIEVDLEPEPAKSTDDIIKAYMTSDAFKAHIAERVRHELARLRGKVE